MGHLLRTVNPEAADAIEPGPGVRRLPEVGEVVRYHMRAGHGRNGRSFFPALVQGHGEQDTLMLTVCIDAQDFADESLVSEIGPGNEFHCWERVSGAGVRPLAERLEEPGGLRGMFAALERRVDTLGDCVLGEFNPPAISIIAIMQDFENRLREMAGETRGLRELLSLEPAVDAPARKPAKKAKGRK